MRHPALHIGLLLCGLGLIGCGRGRVLPERKMVRLYEKMFLADQWLRDNPGARGMADTTLFFDPIFRAEGVTFEDYDRSVRHYIERPDEYIAILTKVSERLRKESENLRALVDALNEEERFRRIYRRRDFSSDSLFRFDSLFPSGLAFPPNPPFQRDSTMTILPDSPARLDSVSPGPLRPDPDRMPLVSRPMKMEKQTFVKLHE